MDNRAIGIFDSGLGGLTCVKKVMEIMPNEDIIYFGDTGRVPYGTRSRETIVKYVKQDIRFLESFDIKYLIIACGTASSAALPNIVSEVKTDIIGVLEPTCKTAVSATRNNKIGVIGTQGTINSGKYLSTIKELNPNIEIISKACPMFVPIVENGYANHEVARIIIKEYLTPIKESGVDTLILGCTHYPILKDEIQAFMGNGVTLIDSGAETAVEVKRQLEEKGLRSEEKSGAARYFVSDETDSFSELGSMFLAKSIDGKVSKVDIEKY